MVVCPYIYHLVSVQSFLQMPQQHTNAHTGSPEVFIVAQISTACSASTQWPTRRVHNYLHRIIMSWVDLCDCVRSKLRNFKNRG